MLSNEGNVRDVGSMKLLLVDCDNTIREPDSGEKFIQYPQDQRIIRGADKAIGYYDPLEWTIIAITNQGSVASGHKSLSDCFDEQQYTLKLFPQLSAIYFCPDYEGRECWVVDRYQLPKESKEFGYEGRHFRKPGAGMLLFAMWQYGISERQTFYVGDRALYEEAAMRAGVNFILTDIWLDRFRTGEYRINSQK